MCQLEQQALQHLTFIDIAGLDKELFSTIVESYGDFNYIVVDNIVVVENSLSSTFEKIVEDMR